MYNLKKHLIVFWFIIILINLLIQDKRTSRNNVFHSGVATIAPKVQRMDACSLQPIVQAGTKRVNPRERLEKIFIKKLPLLDPRIFIIFSDTFHFFHFFTRFLIFHEFFVTLETGISQRARNFFALSISLGIPVTDLLYFWFFSVRRACVEAG